MITELRDFVGSYVRLLRDHWYGIFYFHLDPEFFFFIIFDSFLEVPDEHVINTFLYAGDTIPHVIRLFVPSIDTIPVLWMFSNRRLCITIFTITVSWPLSMYRDISKLAKTSALALSAIFVIIITVLIEGPKMPAEIRGSPIKPTDFINNEVFQAIGVMSFGK
jgi:amino acid permease